MDASGHFDVGHPHPLSGTTIATFITGFGAGVIVGHYLLQWSFGWSLLLATGGGLFLAGAAYLVLDLIFSQTQAGSEHQVEDAVGREAEVITAIPADGVGEIAFVVRGQRDQAPARSTDGTAVPRGRIVLGDDVAERAGPDRRMLGNALVQFRSGPRRRSARPGTARAARS